MQRITAFLVAALVLTASSAPSRAQSVPWVEFLDDASGEVCAIVNTSNAELVVLADGGELVIVTGPDLILTDTFVDESLFVFVGGFPAGLLDYANDARGFPKLWWLGLDGTVVETDPLTGEPSSSGVFPDEIDGALCAACERWDDPIDCGDGLDSDLDGVPDEFDFCDDTPLDEIADDDGCSCGQIDSDEDGVEDCFDQCPDTDLGDDVDQDGCGCVEFDEDDDGINDCFDECPFTPIDEIADDFGCSCSELDSDGDGVDDCFDECPNTDPSDDVDFDGCSEGDVIVVEPPPVIIACGNFTSLTMMTMFAGLCSMRLSRRRCPSTEGLQTEG